jgi:hypothetical protein
MTNLAANIPPPPEKITHYSTPLSSMALPRVVVKTDWQASEFCGLCFTLEMCGYKAVVCVKCFVQWCCDNYLGLQSQKY